MGDGDGGSHRESTGREGHCGQMGKPERHPSPSLKLLKASEHLANCSSPRDANEINSAKCSSGHLQRAWCQVSTWSNPVLLLLLSSPCPFLIIPPPPPFHSGPSAGNTSPPNLPESTQLGNVREGGHVAREMSESQMP